MSTLTLSPANTRTLFNTISSCSSLTHLKQAHAQILKLAHTHHFQNSLLLLELLITSVSLPTTTTPSSLHYALSIFSQIPTPPSHISNKFLRPLLRGRHPKQTLKVFVKMLNEGLNVDRFSFPPLLKAVARAEGLFEGMQVHGLGAKLVFDSDPFLQTGLVEMYAACGRIVDARLVFDKMSYRDVVSWSIMIDGGLFDDVLKIFEEMNMSNVEPDELVLSKI